MEGPVRRGFGERKAPAKHHRLHAQYQLIQREGLERELPVRRFVREGREMGGQSIGREQQDGYAEAVL